MNKAILLLLVIIGLSAVEPHGYVRQPLARTSIFRNPSFGAQMPFWWNDTGVMCGDEVQDMNYSRCGRCGDAFGQTHANQGGTYDKGIITGTYTAGQVSRRKHFAKFFFLYINFIFNLLDHRCRSRSNCQPSWFHPIRTLPTSHRKQQLFPTS